MTESLYAGSAGGRDAKVAAATEQWRQRLIDLGGRNTLLYYKDLRVGTLELADAHVPALERLLAGAPVRLSALFREGRADALKRAQRIHTKIRELHEEKGLAAGYLALGMATWRDDKREPAAPVLLRAVTLTPVSPRRDDFQLKADETAEVNQALLYALQAQFGVRVSETDLLGPEEAADPDLVFQRLRKLAVDVPDFAVRPRTVVGTFLYAKLPMVRDLESADTLLTDSSLVAAVAGDTEAQQTVRGPDATEPASLDNTPPQDEFCVLDADSSQSYVINAAAGGQNIVIQGPPGTGKSQTIANLIATLVARGSRVLFVAEKRAAIDAVLRRLDQDDVRLADLVMDVHDGAKDRRRIAAELGMTLDRAGQVVPPDVAELHRRLVRRRTELGAHLAATHQPRAPWGVSVYELQTELVGLPDSVRTGFRLRGSELAALAGEALETARDNLATYAGLGGFTLSPVTTPWAGATLYTAQQAQAALDTARTLSSELYPRARETLRRAVADTGLRTPATVAEWQTLLAVLDGVRATLGTFSGEVFRAPLANLVAATASRSRRRELGATFSWGERRRLRKEARVLVRSGRLSRTRLHEALVAADHQRLYWLNHSTDDGLPRLPADLEGADRAFADFHEQLRAVDASLPAIQLELLDLDTLADILGELAADDRTPHLLPRLHSLRQQLEEQGLAPMLAELTERQADAPLALAVCDFAWRQSVLDEVRLTDRRYAGFDGTHHNRVIREFQETDRGHIHTSAERVRRVTAERVYEALDTHAEQAARIRKQARLKRGHLPVRALFKHASDVLLTIKPCWAMSPLVVSQILPAARIFDVVIFDEASQVPVADAIPAIMRGRQLVVAGDRHQLPPTRFFVSAAEEELQEEDDESGVSFATGFESILDALDPLLTTRWLAWHYRSRDARLIGFSNHHVYDRTLTIFPGVARDGCLEHALVEQAPGSGQEKSVDAEVDRVVGLILDHATNRPQESLGVIAMGITHASRIEAALWAATADRRDLDPFFAEDRPEPFFVKNLERVQGDERDAIILSIGYGKTADGRMQYRFGPINQEGGERRLNVAVTRAKRRLTFVSSFGSRDLDPKRLNRAGPRLLRAYLEYAESGGRELGSGQLDTPRLNPFEIDVRDRLTAAGLDLIPQYGAGGCSIDFAVAHPQRPGDMVLAIEADGATYRSSKTARDRDRLRQQHLESLGWNFHRIWSTDWFNDPDREVGRVVAAYREAVATADARRAAGMRPRTLPSTVHEPQELAELPGGPAPRRTARRPRIRPGLPITEYSDHELVELIRWVRSDGLLRTEEDLIREAMNELGYAKLGGRIKAALAQAIVVANDTP